MVGGLPHFITIDKVVNNFTDRTTVYTIVSGDQNVYIYEFPNPAANYVFTYRGTGTGSDSVFVDLEENGMVAFENFDLMSAPGFGFKVEGGDTPWLLRNVSIAPSAVETQFVSSYGDGIHCKSSRYGPVIERCTFKYVMDDSINLSGYGSTVDAVDFANDQFQTGGDLNLQPGDQLMFINGAQEEERPNFWGSMAITLWLMRFRVPFKRVIKRSISPGNAMPGILLIIINSMGSAGTPHSSAAATASCETIGRERTMGGGSAERYGLMNFMDLMRKTSCSRTMTFVIVCMGCGWQ